MEGPSETEACQELCQVMFDQYNILSFQEIDHGCEQNSPLLAVPSVRQIGEAAWHSL